MRKRQFCIYCGGDLQKFSGQHLRCSQCKIIHFHNPIPATVGIFYQDWKLLYVRRAREPRKGCWDFAGGFLDNGETGEECMIRECKEELNVDVKVLDYLGSYMDTYHHPSVSDGTKVLNLYYLCELAQQNIRPADDIDGYEWFPLNETPEQIAFQHMREALPHIRRVLK